MAMTKNSTDGRSRKNANLMRGYFVLFAAAAMLAGCISGKPQADSYVDQSGKKTPIESDREQCERACNDDYSRCMDSTDARDNGGVNGPKGMFGESADCRSDLSSCLPGCRTR